VWLLWGALSPSDVFAVDSCSLQIQHRLPYLLLFEDDIIVNATALFRFVEQACAHFEASEASIMQLDTYAEALLISLDGAKLITHRVREVGICKNDDQQLLDGRIMGVSVAKYKVQYNWPKNEPRPWHLSRPTNAKSGHIHRTRRITWAEMALMRMMNHPPARGLPSFGNPAFSDYMVD